MAGRGTARAGAAGQGKAGPGRARQQARLGVAWRGSVGHGGARQGHEATHLNVHYPIHPGISIGQRLSIVM